VDQLAQSFDLGMRLLHLRVRGQQTGTENSLAPCGYGILLSQACNGLRADGVADHLGLDTLRQHALDLLGLDLVLCDVGPDRSQLVVEDLELLCVDELALCLLQIVLGSKLLDFAFGLE